MSDLKKYRELKAKAETLKSELGGMRGEKTRLFQELAPLEAEAMRADVTGEPSARAMLEAFGEKKARHQRLGLEIEDAEKRLRACQELLPEFRGKAISELWDAERPAFERKVQAFAVTVKAAAAAEREMLRVFGEVKAKFDEIDAHNPLQPWPPILLRKSHYGDTARGWERFLQKMRGEGLKVDL